MYTFHVNPKDKKPIKNNIDNAFPISQNYHYKRISGGEQCSWKINTLPKHVFEVRLPQTVVINI